jgi:hypothetical protein
MEEAIFNRHIFGRGSVVHMITYIRTQWLLIVACDEEQLSKYKYVALGPIFTRIIKPYYQNFWDHSKTENAVFALPVQKWSM